jgi:hypothetical protein
MKLSDPWQYELAATLCLVGCIAMPDELFERAYGGQELSPFEDQQFRAHPEIGANLLSKIPRLEVVAGMIRNQQVPDACLSSTEPSVQGAHMLHLALELDRRIYLALERERRMIYRELVTQSEVAQLRSSGRFNGAMLDALDNYTPQKKEFELRQVLIREVHSGMILDEDLWSKDGKVGIFQKGTVLTPILVERLGNFARSRGVQERMRVRVPRADWHVEQISATTLPNRRKADLVSPSGDPLG